MSWIRTIWHMQPRQCPISSVFMFPSFYFSLFILQLGTSHFIIRTHLHFLKPKQKYILRAQKKTKIYIKLLFGDSTRVLCHTNPRFSPYISLTVQITELTINNKEFFNCNRLYVFLCWFELTCSFAFWNS